MYIACEHPVVIQHPHIVNYFYQADFLTLDGSIIVLDKHVIAHDVYSYVKRLVPRTVTDIKKYYAVTSDGEALPLFIEVPCNRCKVCSAKKINVISQQFEFELKENYPGCENLFVTLTYARTPLCNCVCKRHLQLYIKRVRRYVAKLATPDDAKKIKVIYSSEYGKRNTKRPHYHLIFMHFPLYKMGFSPQALKLFEYCWSWCSNYKMKYAVPFEKYTINKYMKLSDDAQRHYDKYVRGFVKVKRVMDGNIGKYVAKYVSKGSDDLGRAKTFFRKSKNLGMSFFLREIKPQLLSNKKNLFTYTDLNNKTRDDAHVCSYFLSKLYPTLSRKIPLLIRQCYRAMRLDYSMLCKYAQKLRTIRHSMCDFIKMVNDVPLFDSMLPITEQQDDFRLFKMIKMFKPKEIIDSFYANYHEIKCYFADNSVDDLIEYKKEREQFFYNSEIPDKNIPDEIFRLVQQYNKIQTSIKL